MTLSIACLTLALGATAAVPETVEFNRDVRPILSDNCFYCHGPDPNHRKADLRLDVREEAIRLDAILPGKPEVSLLVDRILTEDLDELMPPPDSHKKLSPRDKEVLGRWIAQGATYQRHWSYDPPRRAEIPGGEHPVDFLIRNRLAGLGLAPSPEADRRTLLRRLSFDLTGLPPTPDEVAAFLADTSPQAYNKAVDRLLASPHFGERMAIGWLDVVRFADTIGYHSDTPRNVWPYRDYVIASFNANKPFDRFTLEQIAGDLLPGADRETRIGSAFNRLLLSTEEGGAQAKDYEQRMLTDRVRAVGAAWLGQTTGCAQCHDHKFDPFTARDFYSLGAFFADIKEPILGRREDGMIVATPEQEHRLAELDSALQEAKVSLQTALPALAAAQLAWEAEVAAGTATLADAADGSTAPDAKQKLARQVEGILRKEAASRNAKEKQILQDYFRTEVSTLHRAEQDALAKVERERKAFYDPLPKCLVSESSPQKRVVRILPRGNWMDESGEIVSPALPHYLPRPAEVEGRELNRLDLARWLVSEEHPLVARTVVNRWWKQFFGMGLSKVLDDLGAQGELPPNQPLLDWLACEFRDHGWDVKHLVRLIVTSHAYRQTSVASAELLAADPENREIARQSPFRIDAELVRDNALAISGLLVPRIGGPSAKPYQPERYWENLNFPTREYTHDVGENQYRRGLYTWWQRSFLHPSLLAFDAPSREECVAERNRSNIPQQALVLLNDPTYVEAARALATRILTECRGSTEDRFRWAWQTTLQRDPRPEEASVMAKLLEGHLADYRADGVAANSLVKAGLGPLPEGLDAAELAAWTHVARVLLNLHETITRA